MKTAASRENTSSSAGGAGLAKKGSMGQMLTGIAASFSVGSAPAKPAAAQPGGKKHHRHAPRRFRTSSAFIDGRNFRFMLPMLTLVAYYYGTYMWKQSVVTLSEYYKSEVFYSNQVAFMVGQSDYNIRNLMALCDQAYVNDQEQRFQTLTGTMSTIQDGLLYGDESRHLRALLRENKDYFHLMMEDGCLTGDKNDNRYTQAECTSTFFDGLVGRGLQAALKEYIELSRRLAVQRKAAVANPGTCVVRAPSPRAHRRASSPPHR